MKYHTIEFEHKFVDSTVEVHATFNRGRELISMEIYLFINGTGYDFTDFFNEKKPIETSWLIEDAWEKLAEWEQRDPEPNFDDAG